MQSEPSADYKIYSSHDRPYPMLCLNVLEPKEFLHLQNLSLLCRWQEKLLRGKLFPLVKGARLVPAGDKYFRASIINSLRQHLISNSCTTSEALCSQHGHHQHDMLRVLMFGTRDALARSSWCNQDEAVMDLHNVRVWEKADSSSSTLGLYLSQENSPTSDFATSFLGQFPPLCVPNNNPPTLPSSTPPHRHIP